ncbi:hypothetical protein PIIN_10051 [Serendipita indica DSM 11827]|uniref:Uncharacterized protein n=1 Tax=Serendipita indica (strain DSM 11827) TaxID=1109443 RepID=G4TXK8_SERID|nr:hypothetical protein PIIN_10051 [Serendipita indica DSM 11827]
MSIQELLVVGGPPSPAPSTVSSLATQQLATTSPVRNAAMLGDMLYTIAFTILWLFGYARNLVSYIVSLGIIPLQTARQLFGIYQPKPVNLRVVERGPRTRGRTTRNQLDSNGNRSAYSDVEGPQRRTHYSWISHNRKSKNTSIASTSTTSSSDVANTRTHSVPSTPRQRPTLLGDVDQALGGDTVVAASAAAEVEGRRARMRNHVDHSKRRILFVDHKVARRQTAPPASLVTQDSPVERLVISDSPQLRLEDLPSPVMEMQEPSPAHSMTEFGEFVSAPAAAPAMSAVQTTEPSIPPVADPSGAGSGAESISDKKERRPRSGFRLFGRKRSSSMTSQSARLSDAEASMPCPTRLRRKSPYPAKAVTSKPMAVSMSDADATTSTRWLLSRPKRLTKKARSNSSTRTQEPEELTIGPLAMDNGNQSPPHARISSSPINTPTTPSRASALLRSSTLNSTTQTTTPTRTRFNPLRDLEAHLYNRHGLGTGPSTRDGYRATPVPKTGIPRTRPYELPGIERPVPSKRNSVGTPTSGSRRDSVQSTKASDVRAFGEDLGRKSPLRRVSAPPGGTVSIPRPTTPTRAQTQPL